MSIETKAFIVQHIFCTMADSNFSAATETPANKRLVWLSSSDEVSSQQRQPYDAPSLVSLLTRMTGTDSDVDSDAVANGDERGLCLAMVTESNSQVFEDNKFNFPRNTDPGIEEYMQLVEIVY